MYCGVTTILLTAILGRVELNLEQGASGKVLFWFMALREYEEGCDVDFWCGVLICEDARNIPRELRCRLCCGSEEITQTLKMWTRDNLFREDFWEEWHCNSKKIYEISFPWLTNSPRAKSNGLLQCHNKKIQVLEEHFRRGVSVVIEVCIFGLEWVTVLLYVNMRFCLVKSWKRPPEERNLSLKCAESDQTTDNVSQPGMGVRN